MSKNNNVNLHNKLDHWIKYNKNVLFFGKHGVGKTAMIVEAFERHNLKWKYFSASTMDPWVDFVGVPKEKISNEILPEFKIIRELSKISIQVAQNWVSTNWKMNDADAERIVAHALGLSQGVSYLDLIRPKMFAADEVEALVFDEFNRSPAKVRNAVMELIQFGSTNGVKFPKLRFIWAAVNPKDENDTYDVDQIDPAQEDRFHIKIEVPYRPNIDWFRATYGEKTANAAISWWNDLPDKEKDGVSPRRLQYAVETFLQKGDIRDVLPPSSNVGKLVSTLNTGPITDRLDALMKSGNAQEARQFLQNDNNVAAAMPLIEQTETLSKFFIPLLPKEKIASYMASNSKICDYIIKECVNVPVFQHVCKNILDAGGSDKLVQKIRKTLTENQKLAESFAESSM